MPKKVPQGSDKRLELMLRRATRKQLISYIEMQATRLALVQAEAEGRLARIKANLADSKAYAVVEAELEGSPSETAAQKSARLRRLRRMLEDRSLAGRLANLINDGHTTDAARRRLGIGAVRAQRIRGVAVQLGMLKPRQRGS